MNFYADSRETFCRTIGHTLKISHLNQPIRFFVKDDFIITIGPEPVKTIPAFMMPLLVNGLVDAHGPDFRGTCKTGCQFEAPCSTNPPVIG